MKRILFLLLLLGVFINQSSAQSFIIYRSDGATTDIDASEVDSIVFSPQAVAGFGNASFANIGIDKLTVSGQSSKADNKISLKAGQENRAYLNGGFECAHWDMYVRFKCVNGVSFIAGKDNSMYGAWIEIKLDNGISTYTLYNNGKDKQYSAVYIDRIDFNLIEGETYTLHLFFNINITKRIGFELMGQYDEYFAHTFDNVTCNGYGNPFFYSDCDCIVDAFTLSNQNYYDIKNARCSVWGHSYVEADTADGDRDKSFTNLLADALGKDKVFNFGLGGDTFAGVLSKMRNELCFVENVQYGLICIGANDGSQTAEYMKGKVDEIAELLSENNITPIFFTISHIRSEINQAFRETNAYIRNNYLFVDMEQVFLSVDAVNGNPTAGDIRNDLYLGDKVHPTIEGHRLIFNRIKMDCPFLF